MVRPSMRIAIAGATVLPLTPVKNNHIDKAIQMSPTINLSFLNYLSINQTV